MARRRTLGFAALALIAAAILGVLALRDGSSRSPGAEEAIEEAREESHELQEPADAMVARQLYGSDTTAPGDFFEQAASSSRALGRDTTKAAPAVAAASWGLVGPTNIGGRIVDIAVDPDRSDTIYVAAASGGVWRSEDKGVTFEPAWPADQTQAIGAIAITRGGTLFAGTGETGPGGGSITYGGTGVYRSTDRGQSWQRVGLPDSSRISRIVVDPANDDRIFVAASGPLFKPGGQRGLYRSEDGGDTWELVLEGDNPTTGATDVVVDPSNPQRMYAAMWDHLREPDKRRYNGEGSGVYRSDDGGSTWERIGGPIFGPNPAIGRIGLAVAPSEPDTVYAMSSGESGVYTGFFKSTDGGDSWTPRAHPLLVADPVVYGWWFGRVWVDPSDAGHVFVAGLYLIESKDGGTGWDISGDVHADQHAMAWDPKAKDRVYLGNDGGLYRSDDNGTSWEFAKYQPWSQLYGLDVGQQDPSRQVAGLQDNGVNRSYGGEDGDWNEYGGGDGERTLINPSDQQIVYGCSQYGACFVSRDGGDSGEDFDAKVISERKNWFTPIEFDPGDPSTVYTGGERMSRSDDDAGSWRLVSPDLSNGRGRETNPLFRNFGTLTTIAPAPKETGTVYAGTDDGNLQYTHDGGATWTKAADPDLPKAWVTRVEVDKRDPDIAYVTYSGFRQGEDAPYVLRTSDGGKSWSDITANLPRAPLNDVNAIGDTLVVASDVGVFLSRNGGRKWLKLGSGLPLAPIHELRYHAPTQTLYAATFGRGMWRVKMP